MINNKRVVAVILARGQSKRLPGKNTMLLAGKPLIGWTIEAARASKYIDTVIVSSDSEEILEVSRSFQAETPFVRPAYLAEDTTTSEATMIHALTWLKEHGQEFEYALMLQPTSPLRTQTELDAAIELFAGHPEALTLVSLYPFTKNPTWIKKLDPDNYMTPFFDTTHIDANQLSGPWYMPNGAVYIVRSNTFFTNPQFYTEKTISYIMSREKSVDIDDIEDFRLAEYYMSQMNK